MKLPISLIKKYVDFAETPKEIAKILTFAGIEIEKIENEEPTFCNVVAARVEEVEKHPSADKLSIAKVNDGTQIMQVVCGASNCKQGMITAFAKIGATLLDDNNEIYKIKKASLRGVESFGMLCSKKELKLAQDKDGIIELPSDTKIGEDLSFLCEPVFEISLTPNLGHCMSALGIARELAASLKRKTNFPQSSLKEDSLSTIDKKIKVVIETDLCKRYSCRLIENVKVEKSPFWLKAKLEECGINSINNVVDITNLVMLEMGQPLHAFDLDKIEGKIKVISSKEDRLFTSLDKEERKIPKGSICISDDKKMLALGGIIGGLNSATFETTSNILLESAFFDPKTIYKTAKALNLKTESSARFEKGVDPNATLIALDYAAYLIQNICHGKIVKGKFDIKKQDFIPKKICCRIERINNILGTSLSLSEVENIFLRLEFSILESNEKTLVVEVPTFRNDIFQEIDLIEEVGRIYGYNNIEKKNPSYHSSSIGHSPIFLFEKKMKSYLRGEALSEIISCDLISPFLAEIAQNLCFSKEDLLEVKHFKSIDQSILRPSLISSHLQLVKFNHDHKNFDLPIFEIGKVHFKKKNNYIEQTVAAITLSGKNRPHHFDRKSKDLDFFDLKGILENIFFALGIENYKFIASRHKAFHPLRQANIYINEEIEIGVIGEIHPNLLNAFDIKKKIFFSEFNLNLLLEHQKTQFSFLEICPFPSSERDLTITLKEEISIKTIFDLIKTIPSSFLETVYLLDIYKDVSDKKNVSFRFIYRDETKTICFEDVEKEHANLTEIIKNYIKT
jgi:phenylalanyl-tRNA synthetase beta chain